jgi:hypothetical protein
VTWKLLIGTNQITKRTQADFGQIAGEAGG